MRSIVYSTTGNSSVLRLVERATPDPGPGEVRVRIEVSGVNPTDWKRRATQTGPVELTSFGVNEELQSVVLKLGVHGVVMRATEIDEVVGRATLFRAHGLVVARASRAGSRDMGHLPDSLRPVADGLRIEGEFDAALGVRAPIPAARDDDLFLRVGRAISGGRRRHTVRLPSGQSQLSPDARLVVVSGHGSLAGLSRAATQPQLWGREPRAAG